MKPILFILFCSFLMAQNWTDNIMERNPFDPSRGQEPPEEIVEDTPVVLPEAPILDGTMIFGDTRFAIISFMMDGQREAARLTLDQEYNGYKVATIEHEQVTLLINDRRTILKLFDNQKRDRGGTKQAVGMAQAGTPQVITPPDDKPAQPNTANARNNQKPNTRVRKVRQPPNIQNDPKVLDAKGKM